MQLGTTQVPPDEWLHKTHEELCYYCGQANHCAAICPLKAAPPTSRFQFKRVSSTSSMSRFQFNIQVVICHSGISSTLSAPIDYGSARNIMDRKTAELLHIPTKELHSPIQVRTIDGGPIGTRFIEHCTVPFQMRSSSLHQKNISFLITDCNKHANILGDPWLHLHNPCISWTNRDTEVFRPWFSSLQRKQKAIMDVFPPLLRVLSPLSKLRYHPNIVIIRRCSANLRRLKDLQRFTGFANVWNRHLLLPLYYIIQTQKSIYLKETVTEGKELQRWWL